MPYIPDDPTLHARQRLKPAATAPATFGEFAGASANAFLATERSISRPYMTHQAHEEVMDAYRQATGKAFEWRNERGYSTTDAPAFSGGVRRFWSRMAEEIEKNPALRDALPIKSEEGVLQWMQERAAALVEQREQVGARATGAAAAGGFFGDLAAMATDPLIAASFFFGATTGATVLRGMATEAAIGAVSETAVQVYASKFRGELNLDGSTERALQNILTATVGGAGIYAVGAGIARLLRGSPQQTVVDQVLKEQHLADGRPQGVPMEEFRRRMDQVLFDVEEGRAVNVAGLGDLTQDLNVVGLDTIGRRLQSIERQGVPVQDLVPNLGRALELASEGVRIAFSRQRVDGLARRAVTAREEVKPLYAAAEAVERQYADLLEQRSQNTTAQIRNELSQGGRANAVRALDRSTQQRLADIEAQLRDVTDAERRSALNAERRRIVDAARKRVEREAGRLEAEADRLDLEILAAEVRRSEAQKALQDAERAVSEADTAIAREIGGALSDRDLRRLYEERANGIVDAGDMPEGQAARVADAQRAVAQLDEELDGPAAEQITAAREAASQEIAASLPDDVTIDIDGELVSAREAYERLAQREADVNELEACILGR